MKTLKFVLLGLPIYLGLSSSFRLFFNNEKLSDQYYRFIIAFGCLVLRLIIFLIDQRKNRAQDK
jgi:hypothetical protein